MVFPLGAVINAGSVIIGALIGMSLGDRLPEKMRVSVFQGLGLCTMSIGISMSLKTNNALYVIGSIIIGIVLGEAMRLEDRIAASGEYAKKRLRSKNAKFTEGFVSSSLLFCVGSMAIIGSLNEGISGDLSVVLTKTLLDFFSSIAFGAAFGSGVILASLPILLYQGVLTIFADSLRPHLTPEITTELVATGGILIMGIGFNLLNVLTIRLANFLPALLVIVFLCKVTEKIIALL